MEIYACKMQNKGQWVLNAKKQNAVKIIKNKLLRYLLNSTNVSINQTLLS